VIAAGAPVGVITVDLNDLKTANDTHGHAFGDRLIARLATSSHESAVTKWPC
jgi:GGDEF domain-containing protein